MTGHARRGRLATWAAFAVIGGFLAFCLAWRLDGGRWERVETPSMGTVAPVGSLLWVKPTHFASLEKGDFISFHAPGDSRVTYSHRVYRVHEDGTITTKGVIPGPDPWRLGPKEVVGEVRMTWWGAGWLVTMAPVLIVGGLVVGAVRALVNRDWKLPVTLTLGALVATLAIAWYRPLVNAEQLAFAPSRSGGADATYVGTGLLPIRLTAHHGPSVVMRDGEVGTVHVDQEDRQGQLRVDLKPAVPFWLWVVLVLVCFLPALYALVVGFPPLEE
ncbi:MAG: hypothetical protein J7518_21230 [Nocardioidaceae bacterium]|nr:hypothetical protein [Nocardioidaceae bacterium]